MGSCTRPELEARVYGDSKTLAVPVERCQGRQFGRRTLGRPGEDHYDWFSGRNSRSFVGNLQLLGVESGRSSTYSRVGQTARTEGHHE